MKRSPRPPWFFRLSLVTFPWVFRRRFGAEMTEATLQEAAEVEEAHGPAAARRFWALESLDLVSAGFRERVKALAPGYRESLKASGLEVWPGGARQVVDRWWQDLKIGARSLLRRPVYTAVMVLTLALGIGGTSAMFALVHGVLFKPLAFPEPEDLVLGYGSFPLNDSASVSPPDFLDYRQRSSSFEDLAAVLSAGWTFDVTGGDEPERVVGGKASFNIFRTLQQPLHLGRGFRPEEEQDGRNQVAVISHEFWSRWFGGDEQVLGEELVLDGEPHTVVGVLPAGFHLLDEAHVWTPLPFDAPETSRRRFHFLRVFGRLAPGVTLEAAQADVDAVALGLEEAYPESNTGWRLRLLPLREALVGSVRTPLFLLLGAVGLLLLIACGNVAGLMLARSAGRGRETAVRRALGASSGRLASLVLAESFLVAGAGGLAGVAAGAVALGLLRDRLAAVVPRVEEVALNGPVLGVSLALALATGVIFGLAPALRVCRRDLAAGMRGGRSSPSAASQRTRSALVVAQVAVSLTLLAGASLFLRSLAELHAVDPGFEAADVTTAVVSLPLATYDSDDARRRFWDSLLERLEALEGVEAAGLIDILPFTGGNDTWLYPEEAPPQPPDQGLNAQLRFVAGSYFRALRIPLVAGRTFGPGDDADSPTVLMVNESLAERLFPGKDPLGRRVVVDLAEPLAAEVVGVVGDVRRYDLASPPSDAMYFSGRQLTGSAASITVRAAGGPAVIVPVLRAQLRELDLNLPLANVRTLEGIVSRSTARARFRALLLGLFSILAVLLAGVGLYGVLATSVRERRREIGVRMALGAAPGRVGRMVVRQGFFLVAAGAVLGLPLAYLGIRLVRSLLYGVGPADPAALSVVVGVLGAVGLLASAVPALRAAHLDPTEAIQPD